MHFLDMASINNNRSVTTVTKWVLIGLHEVKK